jgi:hypothetical protein
MVKSDHPLTVKRGFRFPLMGFIFPNNEIFFRLDFLKEIEAFFFPIAFLDILTVSVPNGDNEIDRE